MGLKTTVKSFASKLLAFQRSESKFVWILIAVFMLILFSPFLPSHGWGSYIFHLLLLFVILSGILAASDERQIIRQITFIGIFVVALDWIGFLAHNYLPKLELFIFALYALVMGLITVAIILAILRSPQVTANIICGSIAGYLLIGLSGAFVALLIETLHPGAFLLGGEPLSREGLADELIYYSMVSLSTIGYGDITPVAPMARSVSLAVGLTGQIYLTVLVAVLVGKFLKD
ncbi:potassium channel family protein [Leptolyngbya sp. KIOST-1]|uniref:potassium channel family protein n=1 Tax=Leptolyngbya sp. KIOST-1 TaxID=1229172 RepID=UPI00068E7F2D|nr:potassium channel family protein [Leptolyngbya sp. KIOST-1]